MLAFPCNDFGGQEPGTATEIREFCETRYKTTYPLFEKLHAKGADKSPLYKHLTEGTDAGISGEIAWNFTKFLVDRSGKVIARYEPKVDPSDKQLIADIEAALGPAK